MCNRNLSDAALRQLFSRFGSVSAKVIHDRNNDTGSLCYGFVKFQKAEDAAKAIQALNGFRYVVL